MCRLPEYFLQHFMKNSADFLPGCCPCRNQVFSGYRQILQRKAVTGTPDFFKGISPVLDLSELLFSVIIGLRLHI